MNGEVNLEVEVEVICDGFVNAAMQHNGVPFIRQVSITTTANVPEELELAFTFTPRIAEPVSISLPPLGAAKTLRVDAPLIVWDGQALAEKTEREIATMTVSIGSGGTLLWSRDFNFAILAWNEWSGLASLPQLLGAFVQPNHPAIFEVVTLVRDALKQATGDPALMGYQFQDKERVNAVVSAVFASLSALSITYVTAAPSFEDSGQKVRLPEQILLSQMGNCLDLSLFVCGILEHVGLNPLVIVTKEHAMAGCWTVKKNFSQGSMDDLLHLQKLEELGDVLLFDVTAGLNDQTPFSEACEAARVHLIGTVGAFCVIDIKAGRREQILALPSRTQQRSFGLVKENKPEVNKVVAGILERMDERSRQGVPLPLEEAFSSDLSAPKMKRVENWKEKLLDLSLRNRLLNYRESGKSLILECALSAGLEDELACGSSFRIVSRQQTVGVSDPRSAALVEVLKDEKAWHQVLAEAQSRHELLAPYSETELARRLREIAREARVSMEESGANMLFLGLGFLNWKENPRSDQIRQAPLVLLPVQLTRKSMRDAFQLSHLDEDPAVNITLIEKLKKDFGIDLSIMCDPPKDEKGLDISAVFEGFRRAILPLEGWSVSEALCLGLFSFTKFLMWRDLSARSDQLMKGVVAQLAADVRVSCADGEFPDVASLDDTINPQETFCPLSADSSQLAAILAAAQGKSFILEGPPGTGKSQTITNLITHCLASGKKVLFVSEKMAALEVVQHRLKQVGLGRFCLELHSQKAQKRQVLDELGRSLAGVTEASPTGWDRVTTDLSKRRQALNNYARELHRVYPAGLTYYRAISRLSVLRDVPRLSIDFGEDVHALDESSESLLRNKVAELVVKIAPLAPIAAHPLQSVRLTNWAPGITESCATQCDRLLEIAGDLTQSQEECASVLAAPPPQTIQEVRVTGRLVDSLMVAPGVPGTLIDRTAGAKYAAVAMRLVEQEQQQRDLSARVDSWFTKGLWELDLVAIAQKVQRWAGAFFLFAFFALFFTRRKLRSCSCPGRLPGNRELADRLSAALTLMKLRMTMEAQKDDVLALGPLPSDAETRWRLLEQGVSWVESFHSALREWSLLPVHGDATDSRVRRVQELVTADFLSGPPVDAYKSRLAPYSRAVSELELCEKALDTLLCMEGHVFTPEVPVIPLLETMSREYRGALPVLRDWALCQATLGEADEMGLGPLVARLRDGRATPESAMGMYERALCTWFVDHIATAVPALGRFHGKDHQRLIDEFNALDQEILRLTCEHVVAKLSRVASSAPNDGNETSEPGILIAQVKKKRGNLPLRVLFDRIRGLLLRIKPCFLMSPLSVAQYFDPSFELFDVVVFDEASQIPVHDAIGAIARGSQLIVVGDSKQLPPTAFFTRGDSEDDFFREEEYTEMESILAECDTIQMRKMTLNWHYRSRHEHLIAFSNAAYYENRLFTFPSRADHHPRLGVKWRPIEGFYDKGKTRTNPAEARAVVEEIVTRLHDPIEQSRSMGVVTFSIAQQRLIEDLLEEKRAQDPSLEPWFSDSVPEPVFVKNLENVQGDERDVMLFSICYGPDRDGTLSMNFGPLNREGGERRLNVAVTRAREEMVVFSTLTREHIDLRRTSARGVKDLRLFLDYAQRGPDALALTSQSADGEHPGDELVCEMAKALRTEGYEVHEQVGCSRYRLDLAVVHPERAGDYALGIEGDGPSYGSASTARDRDRLRRQVLEGLGWRLSRVWSTDWWVNREGEVARLVGEVKAALAASLETDQLSQVNDMKNTDTLVPVAESSPDEGAEPDWRASLEAAPEPLGTTYEVYSVTLKGTPESLYDPSAAKSIAGELAGCVQCEAPVHKRLLARRVLEAIMVKRITDKVLERCEELLNLHAGRKARLEGDFWWRGDQERASYDGIRVPAEAGGERTIEEIPMEEVLNVAGGLLGRSLSMSTEELKKRAAATLGFSRLGTRVAQSMDAAVMTLVETQRAALEGDRIRAVSVD